MKKRHKRFVLFLLILSFVMMMFVMLWYFCEISALQNRLKKADPFDIGLLKTHAEINGLYLNPEYIDGYNVHIDYNQAWAEKRTDLSSAFDGSCKQTEGAFSVLTFSNTQKAEDWLRFLFDNNYDGGIFYRSYTNENGVLIRFNYQFEFTNYYTIYKVCYVQMDNVVIVSSQDDRSLYFPKIGRTICEILQTQEDNA